MKKLKETFKEASLGYEQPDVIYLPSMSNSLFYLLMFLLGLGVVLIGDACYIFVLAGKGNVLGIDFEDTIQYSEFVNNYTGFVTLAAKILVTSIIYICFRKTLKLDYEKTKNNLLNTIIIVIVGFLLILGISFGFDFLSSNISGLKEAVNEEAVNAILDGKSRIAYAICICSFTPFVEEFVFRKLSFSTFKASKLPRILTIIIVSAIFALIHCLSEDPTSWVCYYHFLQYFLLSLVITLVYALTNENIFASTSVHILNNALGLILYLI